MQIEFEQSLKNKRNFWSFARYEIKLVMSSRAQYKKIETVARWRLATTYVR